MRIILAEGVLLGSIFCIIVLAWASSVVRPQKQPSAERNNPIPTQATNFHLFNPETMAKPEAGYSQVAEVTSGGTAVVNR